MEKLLLLQTQIEYKGAPLNYAIKMQRNVTKKAGNQINIENLHFFLASLKDKHFLIKQQHKIILLAT